jgi:hypothetical protein
VRHFLSLALLISKPLLACPVCDFGSQDTAFFIVLLLVPFVAGMSFLCWSSWKSGIFNNEKNLTRSVLEAENILPRKENKP